MELRFPLDMGVLIITCPNCKHSFKMDPDDPRTYQSGSFDLSPPKKRISFRFPFVETVARYLHSTKDIRFLIPIFLLLILLLNLVKIFNMSNEEKIDTPEKEKQEFFHEEEPQIPTPDKYREPSLEI